MDRGLGDLKQARECQNHAYSIRLKKLVPEDIDVGAVQKENSLSAKAKRKGKALNCFTLSVSSIILSFVRKDKMIDVNPLHPNISIYILLTLLHTSPLVLTRRFVSSMKAS